MHSENLTNLDHFTIGDRVRMIGDGSIRLTVHGFKGGRLLVTRLPVSARILSADPIDVGHLRACDRCGALIAARETSESQIWHQTRAEYAPDGLALADGLWNLVDAGHARRGRDLALLPAWLQDAITDDEVRRSDCPWPVVAELVSRADWPALIARDDGLNYAHEEMAGNDGVRVEGLRAAYDLIRAAGGTPAVTANLIVTAPGHLEIEPLTLRAENIPTSTDLVSAVDQALIDAGRPAGRIHYLSPTEWMLEC